MAFVNECDELFQVIDEMQPIFERKFVRYIKDCEDLFGFSQDHLLYINQSGRREGWDSAMRWFTNASDGLYLYFGRYTSMGPEDKSPPVEVGLVFWREKVFHFHFHQIHAPTKLADGTRTNSNGRVLYENRWTVFFIDYVSGWDGLHCKEKVVKGMIYKIASYLQSILGPDKGYNSGVYYISNRLESKSDFEWESK